MHDPDANAAARHPRRALRHWLPVVGLAALAVASVPALQWRSYQMGRVRCQSNLRRLAVSLLLYAQDHDYRFPMPDRPAERGGARTWADLLKTYVDRRPIMECPWNRLGGLRRTDQGIPFASSYALNSRFWGRFAPGPYPIENLELPSQTVLLVEAGRRRADGPFGTRLLETVTHTYWDTGVSPGAYPSAHRRKMNIVAVDGHARTITVAHYDLDGHNPERGRLGGGIFNWNGGHPNGDTAGPPAE